MSSAATWRLLAIWSFLLLWTVGSVQAAGPSRRLLTFDGQAPTTDTLALSAEGALGTYRDNRTRSQVRFRIMRPKQGSDYPLKLRAATNKVHSYAGEKAAFEVQALSASQFAVKFTAQEGFDGLAVVELGSKDTPTTVSLLKDVPAVTVDGKVNYFLLPRAFRSPNASGARLVAPLTPKSPAVLVVDTGIPTEEQLKTLGITAPLSLKTPPREPAPVPAGTPAATPPPPASPAAPPPAPKGS